MKLSERFGEAVAYAVAAHGEQTRKPSCAPYVSHPLQVAGLVLEYGGSEEEATAALLHDVIEDTGKTREDIAETFGARVAGIVAHCSDAEGPEGKDAWRSRKEGYVAALRKADASTALVSCADKLHNARSILANLRTDGEVVWERFKGKRDGSLWYYRELLSVFRGLDVPPDLLAEFAWTVAAVERASAGAARGETA